MNQEPQDADDLFQLGKFDPPSVEELNRQIPGYEFITFIDRGGMGAVYQARHKALDRMVAVKMLPPALRNRRVFAERFEREAKILAKLNHPHIVAIYDYGESPGGSMYYAMEYVKGTNLRQLMRRGGLNARQLLPIVTQVCEALQYAHGNGVVHRDVKPANILIDEAGTVKVADFGLAKKLGLDPEGHTLTSASDALGTPDYIAPEAMSHNREVDHRADIYSLGVMLYEMLTGQVPKGAWELPSRAAGADTRLDAVVSKALQNNPEKRYQHVSDVTRALQGVLQNGPPQTGSPALPNALPLPPARRRIRTWGGGVLLFLALAASGYVARDHMLPDAPPAAPAQTPPPPPPSASEDAQRKLALWVFDHNGMINVMLPLQSDRLMGDSADIRDASQLPQGKFIIWRISMAESPLFTDEDLAGLVRMCEAADTVSNLNLHGAQIAPASLALVIKLAPTLTHLRLTNTTAFSAESLPFLAACKNLTHLYLTTAESDPMILDVAEDMRLVQKLQELLPECRITVE